MRDPTAPSVLFAWWRDALAGRKPPIHDSDPQCGFYQRKLIKGGPFVASSGEVNLTEAEPRAKDESWADREVQPGQTELRQMKD